MSEDQSNEGMNLHGLDFTLTSLTSLFTLPTEQRVKDQAKCVWSVILNLIAFLLIHSANQTFEH